MINVKYSAVRLLAQDVHVANISGPSSFTQLFHCPVFVVFFLLIASRTKTTISTATDELDIAAFRSLEFHSTLFKSLFF